MKTENNLAKAEVNINASVVEVWDALVNPIKIKEYMFGVEVMSDWKEGGSITWKGEWEGKPYENKAILLNIKPNELLEYSHFIPLGAKQGYLEYEHKITIVLNPKDSFTHLTLFQDENPTVADATHSGESWKMVLSLLENMVEQH